MQFGEIAELRFIYNFVPPRKWYFAVRVFRPELDQCFARDDMHTRILSQLEILSKPTRCTRTILADLGTTFLVGA